MIYELFFMFFVKDNLDLDEIIVLLGMFIIMRIGGSINSFEWFYFVEIF